MHRTCKQRHTMRVLRMLNRDVREAADTLARALVEGWTADKRACARLALDICVAARDGYAMRMEG